MMKRERERELYFYWVELELPLPCRSPLLWLHTVFTLLYLAIAGGFMIHFSVRLGKHQLDHVSESMAWVVHTNCYYVIVYSGVPAISI